MSESPKIAQFPTSQRERKRLLHRSQDMRLRTVFWLRTLSGWLLLVLTIVFIFMHYTLLTPANMRSVANYLQLGISQQTEDLNTISFPSGTASVAVPFASGLAFADSDTLYIASPGGVVQLDEQLSYANLCVCASQNRVLAYDRGGSSFTLTDSAAILTQETLQSPILSADMNENGAFAIVTDEQGYKSAVTIFDAGGAQTYKWSSSEYYIQSAALSPTGKLLAVLVFHADGVTPEGKLLLFTVGQEEAPQEISLGGAIGFSVHFLSEKSIAAVCDTGLYVFGTDGKQRGEKTYRSDEPIAFAVTDGMAAIALHSYHAGARAEVVLLSATGEIMGPLYIDEELQSISLAQNRIAVLTSTSLHIYDDTTQLLWSNAAAAGARSILMRENDLVYAVFSKNAVLLTQSRTEDTTS